MCNIKKQKGKLTIDQKAFAAILDGVYLYDAACRAG
jgi:hypothetical protein